MSAAVVCRVAALSMILLAWTTAPAATGDRAVAVINLGWHTGIALARADIDLSRIPEAGGFGDAAWLEFGWGDEAFYRDPDPDISMYLSAAFVGTPAVMHVVAMGPRPDSYFRSADVVWIHLTAAEHARLQDYIGGSFERGAAAAATPIADGRYPASVFFRGVGEFSLRNTCNTWVARGLAASGLDLQRDDIIQAGPLMQALRATLARRAAPNAGPVSAD